MNTELWTRVMDRLLAGFAHDANGRATALRGVAILAAEDMAPGEWTPLLEHESMRLEQLAAGLSAVRLEPPEPLDVRDALRAATNALGAVHIELRVESAGDVGDVSVRASRGELVRAVIALAFELVPPQTADTVHARVSRAGAEVVVELWVEKATAAGGVLPLSLPGARLGSVPGGYRLSLPALAG